MNRFILLTVVFLMAFSVLADNHTQCQIRETASPRINFDPTLTDNLTAEDIFEPQILAYLNSGASIEGLVPAIEATSQDPKIFAQTVEADFTADNQTDVLVLFNVSWGAGFEGYLNLYTCNDASYQNLS